ncbi:MAG: MFS transporter [Paracoccaceae bacterium]
MGYFKFLHDNARWLGAAALVTFSSSYGQTFFISVFAGEIRSEFGLSNGAWGGIYTLGTALSAIVMVWGGALTDRFRVATLAPVFLLLLAVASLAMAAVPNAWALVAIIFALRFTGQGMMSHIAMVATARWFVATRGRALSVASLGFALGNAVLPLVFVFLLAFIQWRLLWVLAAAMAIIVVPLLTRLLRHERSPRSISADTQSVGMNGFHWRRSEVLRHWLFWMMVPAMLGPAAWTTALFFQQVHLSQVRGWAHLEFVALFPLFTGAIVLTTVATGWFVDRFGTNRMIPFYLLPFGAGFLVLGWSASLFVAAIGMILIGVGTGIGNTLVGAFWAEHCGTRHLGSIKAVIAAVMVFGSAIGPGLSGLLIDRGVNFPDQMLAFSVYFVLAAALAAVAAKRARPLLTNAA